MSKSENNEEDKSPELEKIILHKAKLITDWNGIIYKPDVVKEVTIDSIVRLSMVMPDPPRNLWSHDSPYVSVVEHDKKNNLFLGEVLDMGRDTECNRYPVTSGDRIWFDVNNVIEFPSKDQGKNKQKKLKLYLTEERITITGPLYTIIEDHLYDRDDSDDNSYDSYSDRSDTE